MGTVGLKHAWPGTLAAQFPPTTLLKSLLRSVVCQCLDLMVLTDIDHICYLSFGYQLKKVEKSAGLLGRGPRFLQGEAITFHGHKRSGTTRGSFSLPTWRIPVSLILFPFWLDAIQFFYGNVFRDSDCIFFDTGMLKKVD